MPKLRKLKQKLKLNIFLFAILIVMIAIFYAVQSKGEEFLPARNIHIEGASFGTIFQVKPKWTLLEKIEEAKDLLKDTPHLEVEEDRWGRVDRKQIEVAIMDISTGEIFISRYWLDDDEIGQAGVFTRTYQSNPDMPKFDPVDPNEEFRIINHWWNAWNSEWYVVKNGSLSTSDFVIIADKYIRHNTYFFDPDDLTGTKYSEFVYTPYSEYFHTDEMVKIGKEYLRKKVGQAFEELLQLQVESRAYPGKLVVDTISPEFAQNILIVEQSDPRAMLEIAQTDDEKRRVAERVLVRYALNGDDTFKYTVSTAGASGPAQVMAATGNTINRRYPSANLIPDIDLGRIDMLNAIKLQLLVFDDHLLSVIERVNNNGSKARQIFNNLAPDQLDEVRAMIYNGGASKYDISNGGLRTRVGGYSETKQFIEKLRVIRYLKLFQ